MSDGHPPQDHEKNSTAAGEGLSLSQLAKVLDQVNGLFCAYNTEGRILYMNQKLKEQLRLPDEILNDLNIVDLAIDRHRRRIRAKLYSRMQSGHQSCWELPIRSRDDREFIVVARTSPWYQQGEIVGEILLMEDITGLKLTESELRESQRRLADTIASLPDATAVVDLGGRITYWNRVMEEMTGYPAVDMVGKGDHEYTIPFYGYRRPALLDYIIEPSTNIDKEYSYVHRDGNVYYIEAKTDKLKGKEAYIWARATPLYDTAGQVVGAIETVRDVTERKRAEDDLKASHQRLEDIFCGTIRALAATTEKRDQSSYGHQHRVAALAAAIAREMALPAKVVEDVRIASSMHDIGQLYVPLDILSKPGKLSEIEMLFVKTHPAAGYDILKSIPFEGPIAEIILQHHERLDGSGYPRGLTGEKILLEAKILAVAEVVEAMSSHRPYRVALGVDKALEEITNHAGQLYDEAVVKACIKVFREGEFKFPDHIQPSSA